jgi:4-aminobutyrate aminotransferase
MDRMKEFDIVDPLKIAGQDFYVSLGGTVDNPALPGPSQLMELLTEVSSQYDMDTVFLSNSGAEAVENGIKICYDKTRGQYGITFEGGFHGRTLGALSLNRSKAVYRKHFPEVPGIQDFPYCAARECTASTCGCGFFGTDTRSLRERLSDNGDIAPEQVAYIIIEPIQGEGGYRIPSDAFMDEIADVATHHDIPLIADEIQSGMGRTGKWWGSDHFSIEPDVITGAKALRVGATISRGDVFPSETSRLSSTWGAGDIIAAMQGALTIETIQTEGLLKNATARGQQFLEEMADVELPGVTDVRGVGLMLALDFESTKRRNRVNAAALQRGLLLLNCGSKTIRVLPPLDVTPREITLGVELLADSIQSVSG